MPSKLWLLVVLLLLGVVGGAISKPIDDIPLLENMNEIEDTGAQQAGDYKKIKDEKAEIDATEIIEVPRPLRIFSNDYNTSTEKKISTVTSSSGIKKSEKIPDGKKWFLENITSIDNNNNNNNNPSTRQQQQQGGFGWFLTPLTQKLKFSPETLFHDKIVQLKDTLSHIGSIFPNQQKDAGTIAVSKQIGNAGGLVNLIGLNDSGFYTNRLDPVGFFGGNGWLANKGGILGGPGAFLSTGSLLTDYQTPYK